MAESVSSKCTCNGCAEHDPMLGCKPKVPTVDEKLDAIIASLRRIEIKTGARNIGLLDEHRHREPAYPYVPGFQ